MQFTCLLQILNLNNKSTLHEIYKKLHHGDKKPTWRNAEKTKEKHEKTRKK